MKRLKIWFNDGTEETVSDEARITVVKENSLQVHGKLEYPEDNKVYFCPYRKRIVSYSLYSVKKWQWIEMDDN